MDLYELENLCKASQDNIQARQEVNTGKDAALPLISTTTAAHPNRNETRSANTVSFADKVRGDQPHQINVTDLPRSEMKGNMPSIRLAKQAVERGRRYCQFSLIGRLDFNKIKLEEVKKIALDLWKPQGDWKLVPLGKGYFMIRLVCEEDLRSILGGGPWRFGEQILRLTRWTRTLIKASQAEPPRHLFG
ncbi:hypothetical protein IFM89_031246 [Coptis chinensis]|uniref:DUF4283 domain-containing protein n=1 Tax=Coptis chinensis TaxID=261450 RepID=A0A835ISW1_9MAGN|nr:hypothetical protein IFM89_031246 [Coptis chinensis]